MSRIKPEILSLYFIMGSTNCAGRNPVQVLEAAIRGGITLFQYREKGPRSLPRTESLYMAMQLRNLCHHHGIPFIVNDDVGLAIQTGADGVHLGQDDGDLEAIRERTGTMIMGVSTHNPEEAAAAKRLGADYIGVGPLYPTISKMDAEEVVGPSMITRIRQSQVSLPITGIGGIQLHNIGEVMKSGADGVAVISAIAGNPSPEYAARQLRSAIDEARP